MLKHFRPNATGPGLLAVKTLHTNIAKDCLSSC